MDHTLVRHSTGRRFAQALVRGGYLKRRDLLSLPWYYLKYRTGSLDTSSLSARLGLINGMPRETLEMAATIAFEAYIRKDLYTQAKRYIELLQQRKKTVVLATTSIGLAIQPLAAHLKIPYVLSSTLEFQGANEKEQLASGRLAGEPCYGPYKVSRVGKLLGSLGTPLDRAAFYSDSIHDRFLLQAVGFPVAIHPDRRLRQLANRQSWPIVEW